MDIAVIRQLCMSGAVRWTDHVIDRMLKRGISRDDAKYILIHGKIIEEYP